MTFQFRQNPAGQTHGIQKIIAEFFAPLVQEVIVEKIDIKIHIVPNDKFPFYVRQLESLPRANLILYH